MLSGFLECSLTDLTDQSDPARFTKATCQRCLPACSTSVLATTTSQLFPSSSLPTFPTTLSSHIQTGEPTPTCVVVDSSAHDDPCRTTFDDDLLCSACPTGFATETILCPFLCQISFKEGLSALECSQNDLSGQNQLSVGGPPATCKQCLPPCIDVFFPPVAAPKPPPSTSTINSTCVSTARNAIDTPAVENPNGGISRLTCGITTATVAECPFICSIIPAVGLQSCAMEDLTSALGKAKFMSCMQCLPPCNPPDPPEPNPTCTSITPSMTSSPFVRSNISGTLYKESCGITGLEVAACPFLCTQGLGEVLLRCTENDESGTVFDGSLQSCQPCLMPCIRGDAILNERYLKQ